MPIIKVEDIEDKTFDYVIIGGGTAGLTAAVRLSEDPSLSVLVLEAGPENLGDPLIDIPAQYAQTFGNPQYDWGFKTTKQKNVNNSEFLWSRGKGLGGTSAMNYYCWSKPPAADIDAFEKLGNPGWNWADFEKYSKKSETFHPATPEQNELHFNTFNPDSRGTSGPVQVTIPAQYHTIDRLFQETMANKGLKAIKDPYGGDVAGTFTGWSSLDPKTWTRSYSATAYLLPNISRPNLNVLTSALVSRVIFDRASGNEDRKANSVELIYNDKTYTVRINKEVVLSAGAINSPQILELSGIGQPEVLSQIGVDVEVDLPGVGENVQEHILVPLSYETSEFHETLDLFRDPEYAARAKSLHTLGQGMHRSGITSFSFFPLSALKYPGIPVLISKLEAEVNVQEKDGKMPPGLAEQLKLQISVLRDDMIPDCEIEAFPSLFTKKIQPETGKSYVSPIAMLNHPISRGSIHAHSKDPSIHPTIDPHYFESDADLDIFVQLIKFIRSMTEVEPWRSGILREVHPGPDCSTDDDIREFIKENISTTWHTVGSCSMLPRDKQGVVDSNLKVYGTTNLRVVDISIIPLHINAHTQTTAYMIGEKAADILKGDLKT